MIRYLQLNNVGPSDMTFKFAPRLNLITGDNGVGKSFLLDIVWWCMTKTWPAEINQKLISGSMALPRDKTRESVIEFSFDASSKEEQYISSFQRDNQIWAVRKGRPANPGIVFYAMADGSVAIWDPSRNYWKEKSIQVNPTLALAYIFNPQDIWNGLKRSDDTWLCNGMIRDWTLWQSLSDKRWAEFVEVLGSLSPDKDCPIAPGKSVRISISDSRDIPTIVMPYQQSIPIVHASSGIQRISSLAYLLVWCWEEHLKASELTGIPVSKNITFLIDEVESHLHPKWQRTIIPALMRVMNTLAPQVNIQLLAVTHSPLTMASAESIFNPKQDKWFDFDYVQNRVVASPRDFEKQGDYNNWLKSDAFDLKSSYSVDAERVIQAADALIHSDSTTTCQVEAMTRELTATLPEFDPFLLRWFHIIEKKGWLS